MSFDSLQKVTFPMAFSDPKIYQLIFAGGFRIAAACLSIQNSQLYMKLNREEFKKGTTTQDLIDEEIWFFAGVSVGGLLSVVLFLTCFQRKQYLLIVCLNSLYVLWNLSMGLLAYLDEVYGANSPTGEKGIFILLIE